MHQTHFKWVFNILIDHYMVLHGWRSEYTCIAIECHYYRIVKNAISSLLLLEKNAYGICSI